MIALWFIGIVIMVSALIFTGCCVYIIMRRFLQTEDKSISKSLAFLIIGNQYTKWLGDVIESRDLAQGESGVIIQINRDKSSLIKTHPHLTEKEASGYLLAAAMEIGKGNGHKKESLFER